MALDSEAIWDALTQRLTDKLGASVVSVARRPLAQYTAAHLPAIVVWDSEGVEALASDPDDPAPVWKIGGEIQILSKVDETDPSPTTQLNALVMAVREALEFDPAVDTIFNGRIPEHYTTLGGLVRALAVTKVDKGMGALTERPTAVLTITMEALG